MKINRTWLIALTIVVAVPLLAYALLRELTSFKLDETVESFLYNGAIVAAIGIFYLNRRLKNPKTDKPDDNVQSAGFGASVGTPLVSDRDKSDEALEKKSSIPRTIDQAKAEKEET